jgi:DNA modification methylase
LIILADFQIHIGDCLEVMKSLESDSIDAIVSDPPYGLSFMGKQWDKGVPGVPFWQEALRVAKPGTHILAAGGSRTYHRLACAIEDAGWEIRDCVMWIYGSGFPKSHDVSKAIDKAAGAERDVIARTGIRCGVFAHSGGGNPQNIGDYEATITAPATEAARQWQGWGTALKPAFEPFILARKPLDGTVAENVLTHGTGGLNVDGCRVGSNIRVNPAFGNDGWRLQEGRKDRQETMSKTVSGRWPANVIHDGSDEVVELFPHVTSGARNGKRSGNKSGIGTFHENDRDTGRFFLSSQGSAARFFYCPKASRAEREAGLDGMELSKCGSLNLRTDAHSERTGIATEPARNHHPTVKPIDLMAYLARLITPPNGTILDPFTGSGSTGVAAMREGFNFIGIEINPEYAEIARRRIEHEKNQQESLLFSV